MHKKVYFGPKPLYLTTEITGEIAPFADNDTTVVKKELNQANIKDVIIKMQEPNTTAGIFIDNDCEALLTALKKEFDFIQAGGGFVFSEKDDEVLLILRRGKWDLPKGKLDPEEQIEHCALREVVEETGLQELSLKQFLCSTYHTYHQGNSFVLKESLWFLMSTSREQVLTPQTEEDIEKCEWVKLSKIAPYLDNSFPAIIDVVESASKILKGGKQSTNAI